MKGMGVGMGFNGITRQNLYIISRPAPGVGGGWHPYPWITRYNDT